MGLFAALQQFFGLGKRTVNVVVIGLDNSGKVRDQEEGESYGTRVFQTTILNGLRSEETRVSQVRDIILLS